MLREPRIIKDIGGAEGEELQAGRHWLLLLLASSLHDSSNLPPEFSCLLLLHSTFSSSTSLFSAPLLRVPFPRSPPPLHFFPPFLPIHPHLAVPPSLPSSPPAPLYNPPLASLPSLPISPHPHPHSSSSPPLGRHQWVRSAPCPDIPCGLLSFLHAVMQKPVWHCQVPRCLELAGERRRPGGTTGEIRTRQRSGLTRHSSSMGW